MSKRTAQHFANTVWMRRSKTQHRFGCLVWCIVWKLIAPILATSEALTGQPEYNPLVFWLFVLWILQTVA